MTVSEPAGASPADDLLDRVEGAEHVRHVHDRDELRPLREQLVEVVEVEAALVVDAHVLEPRAGELPRHDVRVVLHLGEHHEVALGDVRARDEVDRAGRVRREDRAAGSHPSH
jgi:hypothetical protein